MVVLERRKSLVLSFSWIIRVALWQWEAWRRSIRAGWMDRWRVQQSSLWIKALYSDHNHINS